MKISIKKTIDLDDRNSISDDEFNFFIDLKSSLYNCDICVAGIVFLKLRSLFLFPFPGKDELYIIANSCFFDISDSKCSRYWNFYLNNTNKYIYYFGYDFNKFDYIGIKSFVENEEFCINYHQDNISSYEHDNCVHYLKEMTFLLKNE